MAAEQIPLQQYHAQIKAAASALVSSIGRAEVAVVLGSGLSKFTERLAADSRRTVHYSAIPGMPQTTVKGHDGCVVSGTVPSKTSSDGVMRVYAFAGRVHAYEGWAAHEINFMARMCAFAGVRVFFLTNSAGGCLPGMNPGSILCLRDHIRWTGMDPLADVCEHPRFGRRGASPIGAYSDRLAAVAREASQALDIEMHEGVYNWTSGPTYETPAEVQAGIVAGGGAFGMSTVPEVLAGHAVGMEVFGLSLATNLAAGLLHEELLHDDVTKVAREAGPKFERLVMEILANCNVSESTATNTAHAIDDDGSEPELNDVAAAGVNMTIPRFWQPSPVDVASDAEHIASQHPAGDALVVRAALFLGAGHSVDVTAEATVKLSALPVFSKNAHSASGVAGEITVGQVAGQEGSVLIISAPAVEGFLKDEAGHLVQVARTLGAQRVVQTLDVHPVGEGSAAKAGSVADVSDVFSFTQHGVPRPVHPTLAGDATAPAASSLPALSCVAFAGPTQPTPAEMNLASLVAPPAGACVAGSYTVTSVGPLLAARSLGIASSAVGSVEADAAAVAAAAVEQLAGVEAPSANVTVTVAAGGSPLVPDAAQQRSYEGARQHDFDHVSEAATACLSALSVEKGAVDTVLYVEGPMTAVLEAAAFTVDASVDASSLPHWTADQVGGNAVLGGRWQVQVGSLQGHRVLVVRTAGEAATPFTNYADLGFATRMFGQMGVNHHFVVPKITSCHPDIKVGEVVAVADHVNISGINPLFGINEERWGGPSVRFPDMGNAYDKSIREQLGLPNTIVANANDTAHSPCEGRFASALKCTSLAAGFVPLVILARHQRAGRPSSTCAAVAFVDHSVVDDESAAAAPVAVSQAAVNKIGAAVAAAIAATRS